MALRALFPTLLYQARLSDEPGRFSQILFDECQSLRASDSAGRRWSARHYLRGYTSYGSLDRLHLVSSVFDDLRRRIDPHVRRFVGALHYDLAGCRFAMTDCWLNVMSQQAVHSLHLHPLSFISGTYYVAVPRAAGMLKFEDPRLSRMMAAPPRRSDAPARLRNFVSARARAGDLVLFESWLRHEVPPGRFAGERISISFNYGWTAATRTSSQRGARKR
jgi:uncharacterized protein (TIGR02466 family)